jgi:hypothetical protein
MPTTPTVIHNPAEFLIRIAALSVDCSIVATREIELTVHATTHSEAVQIVQSSLQEMIDSYVRRNMK